MTVVLWMLLAASAPAAGAGASSDAAVRVAQAFRVHDDDTAKPKKKKPGKKKKKKKKKKVESEADLWSDPDEGKSGGKKEEDEVEEIPPEDEIEDVEDDEPEGEGDPGGLGGWGADVERDSWGDEKRIPGAIPDDVPPDEKEPDEKQADKPETPDKPATTDAAAGTPDGGLQPDADAGPSPEEAAELAAARGEIKPLSGSLADLPSLWEQRRMHLVQHDFALAQADLQRILQLKEELGIRNMALETNVLIREASRARQAEDTGKAQALIDAARKLAPEVPAVHLAQASLWFSESPFKVGRLFNMLSAAAEASLKDPITKNRLLTNLIIGLLLGLGLAAALFVVVQFLRYLRLFLHDFHHLFPRGVARLQTGLLAILLLVLPILFRAGLLTILLVWAFVAWIYQERNERIVSLIVVAFFATAPLALKLVVDGLQLPDSLAADLIEVSRGPAPKRSVVRLKGALEEQPNNHVILAALGDLHKRTGRLTDAKELFGRALKVVPDSAVLLNNMGNVAFLSSDFDAALQYYSRATQARPDLAVPYYNLSRVYYGKLDLNKAKEHRGHALRLDSARIRALARQAESRHANHVVADLEIPNQWLLAQRHVGNGRWEKAGGQMWRAWGGAGSTETFPYVGAGLFAFFALFWVLRGKMSLSSGCVRCGRAVCRRCNTELRDDTLCGQCFHAFIQKDHVDAKSRISKEIQIRQHSRRRESFARGITFVLPGVGQLIKSRPLRGALFLSVSGCVLVQVLFRSGVMRSAQALGAGVDWLKLVPLLALFAGFYVWAILDVFRMER